MSTAVLVIGLGAVLATLVMVLNQVQARLALVEVTLNEGLPPGHAVVPTGEPAPARLDATAALGEGTHVFLSRSCHACQRLLGELGERPLGVGRIHFRFVDHARPFAMDVARVNDAAIEHDQDDLAAAVGADPLPYTVAVGDHGLVAGSVTPTRAEVLATRRQAGLSERDDR